MNNETVGDRFKKALELKYGDKNNPLIAKKYNYKPQTIGQAKTKKAINETISLICEKENINLNWIQTGKGEIFILEDTPKISVNNSNNVAVNNGNGTITINTKDYVDSNEIKELLELLKDVPKSWIHNIIERLKKSLNAIDNDFK